MGFIQLWNANGLMLEELVLLGKDNLSGKDHQHFISKL
jgi:hypothetical protein